MEGNLQCSPKLGYPADCDDAKYVSGLSTILVATIQEAKDRISQIEYVFCSQLYPNFQSKAKSLQKIYSEGKKEAEDAWRKKEDDLLLRIEKLRIENERIVEENKSLKLDKQTSLVEIDKENISLVVKVTNQQIRIDELEHKLQQKSKEVDEGMEFQKELLQLIQTKSVMVVEKGKQLKEHEEKTKELLAKLNGLEKKVEELQSELNEKIEEVAEKKELLESSTKRIESLVSKLMDSEELLTKNDEEKKKLAEKLQCAEEANSELQVKLREKTEEIEEGRSLHAQLLQQIDINAVEIFKQKQQLEESDNDRKWLLDKVSSLEEKVILLQKGHSGSGKVAERKDSYEKLTQQIELKTSELLAEKKNYSKLMDKYKSLKSQHIYLRTKMGLTTENMLPQNKLEDDDGLNHQQDPATSPDGHENKISDMYATACERHVKIENEFCDGLENEVVKSAPTSSFHPPTSNYVAPKCPASVKSAPTTGTKRPASHWIDTRSRQCKDGPDPHDDFLDTPFENIRMNLKKAVKEEVNELQVQIQKVTNPDSSDDETQNMNVDPNPGKQKILTPIAGKGGFKYVEPVRKKAERENLKGVECKQCKKFYDAVLATNGGKGADDSNQSVRCEHHHGVSRHRYKYVPPMTPEGFWNIGFESEM